MVHIRIYFKERTKFNFLANQNFIYNYCYSVDFFVTFWPIMNQNYALTSLIGLLTIVSILLHALLLYQIFKVHVNFCHAYCRNIVKVSQRGRKSQNLTVTFLLVNSISQLLYLAFIAPTEMYFMITSQWDFGLIMCKLFKSWRSTCAGKETLYRRSQVNVYPLFNIAV